ncbi:hypothetical protein P792_02550 [Asaia sp. SF2.1]|nr:hypothetical protein P792_02550 [Asaia sp. SF2.1]
MLLLSVFAVFQMSFSRDAYPFGQASFFMLDQTGIGVAQISPVDRRAHDHRVYSEQAAIYRVNIFK